MDTKKYLIMVIVVFVAYSAVAYGIHQVLLRSDYEALGEAARDFTEFTQRMPLLYLANLIFSLAFCYIYVQGYEPGKSWFFQGVRYGVAVATLMAPMALVIYVAVPIPGFLAFKLMVVTYPHVVIAALVAAGLYQTPSYPWQV